VPEAQTISVKYIYLDIVGYTRHRSIEAQTSIIGILNNIVRKAVASKKRTSLRIFIESLFGARPAKDINSVTSSNVIYIPTGDGMCIALLNVSDPVDAHMQIALEILLRVEKHNSDSPDRMRQFKVRIGINGNDDNVVNDINGRRNVAGSGISDAQRIMDMADGGQILVGHAVFKALNPREKYMTKFKPYEAHVKHGEILRIYQYVEESHPGLNTEVPSVFRKKEQPEPKMTKFAAYYFAHAVKLREIFRLKARNTYAREMLLWFLAYDSVRQSEATELEPYDPKLRSTAPGDIEEQLTYFGKLPFWVSWYFAELAQKSPDLAPLSWKYFEGVPGEAVFVNAAGKDKLRREWPEIWREFGFR
jgi:hypothetical protein